MHLKFFFSILFGIACLYSTNAQSFDTPSAYNNYIVEEQFIITNSNLDYITTSVHSNNYDLIEQKRQGVISQIKKSLSKIEAMPPFKGETKIRDEAISVLQNYLETFQMDFNEALTLKKTSEESYEAMERYFEAEEKAIDKLDKASERFDKAQKEFAKKHDMIIEGGSEQPSLINKIAELNDYTRAVYLNYFKVSKTNAGFLDALQANKPTLLQRKREQLETDATEALKNLKTIGAFREDRVYVDSAIDLVNYHQQMASKDFKTLTEVANKKQEDLTQADVDNYNKIITHYNQQAQILTNRFNEAFNQLMQRHIPAPGKRT